MGEKLEGIKGGRKINIPFLFCLQTILSFKKTRRTSLITFTRGLANYLSNLEEYWF